MRRSACCRLDADCDFPMPPDGLGAAWWEAWEDPAEDSRKRKRAAEAPAQVRQVSSASCTLAAYTVHFECSQAAWLAHDVTAQARCHVQCNAAG